MRKNNLLIIRKENSKTKKRKKLKEKEEETERNNERRKKNKDYMRSRWLKNMKIHTMIVVNIFTPSKATRPLRCKELLCEKEYKTNIMNERTEFKKIK